MRTNIEDFSPSSTRRLLVALGQTLDTRFGVGKTSNTFFKPQNLSKRCLHDHKETLNVPQLNLRIHIEYGKNHLRYIAFLFLLIVGATR